MMRKTTMGNSLEVHNLHKSIGRKKIVSGVSISLRPKEIVGLLGPNGAGKTTCFYIIAGIEKQDIGSITLNGKDISTINLSERSSYGLAYLPQESSIFRGLTVEDNLRASLELKGVNDIQKLDEEIDTYLSLMSLKRVKKTMGSQLSGGERRRVEIARLLCQEPHYLLLDEPFAGIDPISVTETQKIIKNLSELGLGILITDHSYRDLLPICERAYFLENGSITVEGNEETIVNNEAVQKNYLGLN